MCGLIIGIMVDNQATLRLDRVSQHAFVRRKKAWLSQAPVNSSSFDVETSTSKGSCIFAFVFPEEASVTFWCPENPTDPCWGILGWCCSWGVYRRLIRLIATTFISETCYEDCVGQRCKIDMYLFFEIHML